MNLFSVFFGDAQQAEAEAYMRRAQLAYKQDQVFGSKTGRLVYRKPEQQGIKIKTPEGMAIREIMEEHAGKWPSDPNAPKKLS